jgi:hypothetical protein
MVASWCSVSWDGGRHTVHHLEHPIRTLFPRKSIKEIGGARANPRATAGLAVGSWLLAAGEQLAEGFHALTGVGDGDGGGKLIQHPAAAG